MKSQNHQVVDSLNICDIIEIIKSREESLNMEIIYKSFDNKIFLSEESCRMYEQVEVSKNVKKEILLDTSNKIVLRFKNLRCHILELPNLYDFKKYKIIRGNQLSEYASDDFKISKINDNIYILYKRVINIDLLKVIIKKLTELDNLNIEIIKNINYLDIYAKANLIMEMVD